MSRNVNRLLLLSVVACSGDPPPTATNTGLNLRPALVYAVQSVQTQARSVPLIAGRAAMLRVFVTASEATTASPEVRVRLFNGLTQISSTVITATTAGVPTAIDEGNLERSWNLMIPAAQMQPGLALIVEVDPQNTIAESSERDNAFPASDRAALDVRVVPAARVTVVPVVTGGIEGPPRVTAANALAITDLARKLFPFPTLETFLHAPYSTTAFQDNDNPINGWFQVLQELAALRTAEASSAEYLGILRLETNPELLGLASRAHVGVSHDDIGSDADTVAAHELGHVWGLRHANCGGAGGPDATYPYPDGATGAFGLDIDRLTVMPPTKKDVMGYCSGAWISDFHFKKVLVLQTGAALSALQPAVIVWGRISNGRVILQPTFRAVTRVSLPDEAGPYRVRALDTAGRELFALSFAGAIVEDVAGDQRIFAFAVPLPERMNVASWVISDRGSHERNVRAKTASVERGGPNGAITRIIH